MNPLIGRKNGKMVSNPIRDALLHDARALSHRCQRMARAIGTPRLGFRFERKSQLPRLLSANVSRRDFQV